MHGSTIATEPAAGWLDQVYAGMGVCDGQGDRIGMVLQVYRHPQTMTDMWFVAEWQSCPLPSDIVEVEAERLAPGLRLYLPADAIETAAETALVLRESREELERASYHGWDTKPGCTQALCPLFGPHV